VPGVGAAYPDADDWTLLGLGEVPGDGSLPFRPVLAAYYY
jgi:hypothetical protein